MEKTKKQICIGLGIAAAVLVLLFLGGSWFIGAQVVEASTRLVTNEQTMELYRGSWEHEGFDEARFRDTYAIEEVSIDSSFDDHALPFDLITAEGNENLVIMAHGILGNRLTNYPTAEIFLEHGCNVLTYDQRSSGDNFAERSTFGCWEKYDLMDCIRYARERYPEAKLVVWGESFGGATAILGVAQEEIQQEISALILDCPVSSMAYMIETSMEEMGLPLPMGYLMACGNLVNRMKLGFSYEEADCTAAAAEIAVPTLIFHSKADEITPEFMGREIYEALGSARKDLYTAEHSAHIEIRLDERETYIQEILNYLP